MAGPNDTILNITDEDILLYPSANTSLLPPSNILSALLTNLTLTLLPSLDYSQLLYQPECPGWVPLNHIYYQVANVLLLLASIVPHSPGGFLFLRCFMGISFSFSTVWGWKVACGLDTTAWNCLLALINMSWFVCTLWRRRTVLLSKEMERVYTKMFQPLQVSRGQFKTLLNGTKEIRKVSANEFVIQEKLSRVDSLSLVLKGRLVVSQAGRALHLVTQNQFLDSPEWFGVTTDEYFQVTVTALEECSILVWHRDKIKFVIMEDPFLQTILDHVIGRDVVRKLMQVHNINEELNVYKSGVPENGDNLSVEEDKEDYDDKKPMIEKESTKDTSLMATIIGGDMSSWRLGNIRETEDETID